MVGSLSTRAALFRIGQSGPRWVRGVAAVVVLVLIGSLLQPGTPAFAVDTTVSRGLVMSYLLDGGPSVRRAAEAALLGSAQDLDAFIDSGLAQAQEADERAAAQVLAGLDGPSTRQAAINALAGSAEDVRAFVNGGWKTAWAADERVRVHRVMETGGPSVTAAAQAALAGSAEQVTDFLASGRRTAERADDRLAATRMLTGGANGSGPVLDAAAQAALAGSAEELREFLTSGQWVARARDQELASIGRLTQQAKEASELTARESLAASEASTRAVNAAAEAKAAAQTAEREAAAAGGAAGKASAAAGRAADAAAGAAAAAREAVSASNAAMRAARIASDAARKATAAASLTAQAAARAQRAAADARTDAGKAAAARQQAELARDAARKVRELDAIRAQRDRALAQAKEAANAARSASANADAAAVAADQAAGHAGVSAAQAERARRAARQAQQQAAAAARAADRAYALAVAAARASDQAFAFAEQAARHAEAAAAAAEAAAAAAGNAAAAAAESARHAAAAVEAANVAVAAANQAVELERLAREEDQARLEEATAQGVLAAQEERAAEQARTASAGELVAWNRGLRWDTAEEDRIDRNTRQLLSEAVAPGASTDVVLDRGRRAAAALVTIGGEWTREAAQEALAGGEPRLRSWLADGRRLAVGQDDRARLWHLVDTLPDGAEKTAAQTALAGDDAAVQAFLRTRAYPGKTVVDRREIYRILQNAGPNVTAEGERALAGSGADMHRFLRTGQYTARAADERIEVYRAMETGGPQVKAAGQVALAGPASSLSYFLAVSLYRAAQRDVEQAAHVAKVQALIREAQQYAQSAVADAAEANRVAAVARNAATEAAGYLQQANAAAGRAADFANQARQSAAAAKQSADEAAQSAAIARNAANSAQASANSAARSATTAGAAARRARADVLVANKAKWEARLAAQAAGQDAVAADLAAKEAAAIYTARLKEIEAERRSTAPGSGSGGTGTALDDHKTWSCLLPDSAPGVSGECLKVFVDFADAIMRPEKCYVPANADGPGCTMYVDLKSFVEDNPELILDMLQLVLMACGLVPGAGEVCDGIDAGVSFARDDWVGGLLSVGAMIPIAGYLATAAKGGKAADKIRNILKIVETLTTGCRRSSFLPGTRVLLANGRTRPIERVRIGDSVLATDPASGTTAAKAVTATIGSVGVKELVDITVDTDGDAGAATGSISATANHPFWTPRLRSFVSAARLSAGQSLRDAKGGSVQVVSASPRTETTPVHNLTVAGFHTYYVLAGNTAVLVHNAGGGGPAACGIALDMTGKVHGDLPTYPPSDWTRDQLEDLADDLRISVANRKAEQLRLGEDGPHRARIGQEETLLRQIERILSGS
jgi:hypothetical protein